MRNPKAIPLLVWILAALAGCGPDERAEDGEDPSAPRDPAPMLAVHEAPLVATLPAGFEEVVVLTGLAQPSAIAFSPDGRVFVAEKSGLVKVFPSLGSTQPTVFADLRTQVHNFWDRGLLGLALHPNFPATPWVYVLYTRDA
jgi:glucose/arabinose dehydrogenase